MTREENAFIVSWAAICILLVLVTVFAWGYSFGQINARNKEIRDLNHLLHASDSLADSAAANYNWKE